MISMALNNLGHTDQTKTVDLHHLPKSFKWDHDSSELFQKALDIGPIRSMIDDANTLVQEAHDEASINNATDKLTKAITSAAKIALRTRTAKKKNNNKPWYNSSLKRMERDVNKQAHNMTVHPTGESRKTFFLALKQYRKARKYAKRHHIQNQLTELATLQKENPKQFWKLLQNIDSNTSLNNHADKIAPGQWYEHLSTMNSDHSETFEMKKREINKNISSINFTELDFSIKCKEIKEAIKHLKNNKTTGLDRISNEMLKNCNDHLLDCITKVFNKIYALGTYPDAWSHGYITNIHKKGSYFDPKNYRGITIMSCLGKLFNSVLSTRLSEYLSNGNLLSPSQIGFEKNSRTTDHIFTLKTIIDKYTQAPGQKLYTCFVDFKQAFDKIHILTSY